MLAFEGKEICSINPNTYMYYNKNTTKVLSKMTIRTTFWMTPLTSKDLKRTHFATLYIIPMQYSMHSESSKIKSCSLIIYELQKHVFIFKMGFGMSFHFQNVILFRNVFSFSKCERFWVFFPFSKKIFAFTTNSFTDEVVNKQRNIYKAFKFVSVQSRIHNLLYEL